MKKLNDILGTEFPFIQGGMANIATGEFAAACSNAGALGVIATGGMLRADLLREQIHICKSLTDKPFGVNLMLMNPCADEMAQVIVEEGVQVVTTGAGSPGKYIPAWKEAGIKVFPVVAASILAKRLVNLGADAIIAEGIESGGHVGEMTTMARPRSSTRWTCPSSPPAASPAAVRWPRPSLWAPAASRWAPACWQARSAPSTTTISRPS